MSKKKAKKPPATNVGVGAMIRAARSSCGMTQEKLGDEIGVTYQAVAKYENGKSAVTAIRLIEIARALDVPAASLLPE